MLQSCGVVIQLGHIEQTQKLSIQKQITIYVQKLKKNIADPVDY